MSRILPLRSRMAMASAASGKRSSTERCTASTVRPPMIGVSQSRPSMVAVSLSLTSNNSSPRACTDDGIALAPAAAAVRMNIARVSRRVISFSLFRHVDDGASGEKNPTAILMPYARYLLDVLSDLAAFAIA
ncbi:hypothetical protein [Reyranella soli]|uniref:hypothetical protein n=1 Tax=Reyranella soli TaxID=1230389 RepID=UPI0011BEC433|nr:hypothetical protein [Reyranella soli]